MTTGRPRAAGTGAHQPEAGGAEVCRYRDPHTGTVAEVRTDGVPVGLAFPESLTERHPRDLAAIVLRTLVATAARARELLEIEAEQDWEDTDDWEDSEVRDAGEDAGEDDHHGNPVEPGVSAR